MSHHALRLPELGLNEDSIAYEVALDALGQSLQPLMQAIVQERAKPVQVFDIGKTALVGRRSQATSMQLRPDSRPVAWQELVIYEDMGPRRQCQQHLMQQAGSTGSLQKKNS
jgi:hypothetical protein